MNLRIYFITSVFPPTTMGGVERYLLNILEILGRRGIFLKVLTGYYPLLPKNEDIKDYSVKRIGLNLVSFFNIRYINPFLRFREDNLHYKFIGYFQVLNIINEFNVINSQLGYKSNVILGNKLANKMEKKRKKVKHN